eukprot:CAMPEP_0185570704 /NCGR_PEP_ID=MMETSP0434-20130131/2924_1 /TAXON_ID=626734 ORGANISM="Favella taraikaensis, Strain Fe Narragansett Bay" /NCGR_SAMPLE_ID=MMETSP0434 /ASSEMBLY_ACC=CAM_ASM_000379 /LENGTH=116 /DNA_ID=CAMNT_0028185903 /DNA_START=1840 /DNA_END=2190 /DNA_ORIENTATION=-
MSVSQRPSSILSTLLQRQPAQQSSQVTDSFNIYTKKGNALGSSRRHQAKKKGAIDKKLPNTSRNESTKSTPSCALSKAKDSGGSAKNFQSSANIMNMQGAGAIRSSGSDRNLLLSS